ncbi:MAG: DUF1722 domain-containing protein [Candidatus Lokiarchaeota archaeon]|nr:DUF1722 domain-containing protein [Candidatus Lokiarchaeota archaeon]
MSNSFPTPQLFCSRCITFDYCRWNAGIISSEKVDRLKSVCEFVTNCPEKEIGLGVPRDSLRLVEIDKTIRLVQPATENDYTEKMIEYSKNLLSEFPEIDGFILKGKSPSCGYDGVKLYSGSHKADVRDKSAGVFGGILIDTFGEYPIVDEYRLENPAIWEHFITQIYTIAAFREIKSDKTIQNLIDYHSRHKFQLMAYDQNLMRLMGRLVANQDKQSIEEIYADYEILLLKTLSNMPRYTQNINVLYHALGYFKEKIGSEEKQFFIEEIEAFRHGVFPLSVCLHIIRNWIIRFEEEYLHSQTYFRPYPDILVNLQPFSSRIEKLERLQGIKKN